MYNLFDVEEKIDPELYQLLLSLRIGDGSYSTQSVKRQTYTVQTCSTKEDYVLYKKNILLRHNFFVRDENKKSGYKTDSKIYSIKTRIDWRASKVAQMRVSDVVRSLDKLGLILYYLDDGSLHKTKHFMNIYCSSFSDEDTELLMDKIYELYPIKRCKMLKDKKRDGRVFNYVGVPLEVAQELSKDTRKFLIENNISSLLYKTISPSQTIESI